MALENLPIQVEMSGRLRAFWGILGGLVAVASKYIGQDHYWLRVQIDTRNYDLIPGIIFFYVGLAVVLCLIGGVFAVASEENNRLKVLAIAVSAPALITTWLGGARAELPHAPAPTAYFSPISAAVAAELNTADSSKKDGGFWQGFLLPLGFGKDDTRYRVVVGSFTDKTTAALAVEKIKRDDPTLPVFVGEPAPGNPYYAVAVGSFEPYPDAKKTLERVKTLPSVKDAYLSPYQFR